MQSAMTGGVDMCSADGRLFVTDKGGGGCLGWG